MAIELSASEERNLDDLKVKMQERVQQFKEEWQSKSQEELQQELMDLEEYLKGCYNSEIDDTEINIRFCEGKSEILKKILK